MDELRKEESISYMSRCNYAIAGQLPDVKLVDCQDAVNLVQGHSRAHFYKYRVNSIYEWIVVLPFPSISAEGSPLGCELARSVNIKPVLAYVSKAKPPFQ